MTRHCVFAALYLMTALALAGAAEKRKIATLSFADFIDPSVSKTASLSSKDAIAKTFRSLREQGFTDVYWRVSGEGHSVTRLYYFNAAAADQMAAAAKEYRDTPYAWDPYELRWPVEAAWDGSIAPASTLANSATRRVRVENSIALRNAIRWL